jgi:hypothetical protein
MGRLGDFFPEDDKQEYVDRQLKPGQILYLFCEFTNPPKDKYFVLVGFATLPMLFVINSTINPFVASQPHLRSCQVKLSAADYAFLRHDSYINCAEVIGSLSQAQIRQQILADTARMKGELNVSTKQAILQVVQGASTITPHQKRLITEALE